MADPTPSPTTAYWAPRMLQGARATVLRNAETGVDYRISLYAPSGEAPAAGFPIVYLLDGESLFAGASETAMRLARRPAVTGVAPLIVVGIGRVMDDPHDAKSRHDDFAPDDGDARAMAAFMAFVTGPVRALVEAGLQVDPAGRALLGHSLAGYFALLALASRPDAFSHYGALSPSIWWGQDRLTAALEGAEIAGARVFLSVGEREEPQATETSDQERRASRKMVSNVKALAAVLRGRVADLRLHVLADEDHASVVGPATVRFLRFLCEA